MLSKLFKAAPKQISTVPDWLVGFWKREYIFDSDGRMDEYNDGTKVVYMQTQSAYIDFRIPDTIISEPDFFITSGQTLSNPFNNYHNELFDLLGTQLCDSGECIVEFKHNIDEMKIADIVHQGHNIIALEKSNTVHDFFTFPIAQWNADINYQLQTNYPEPGILTQHESRKECMFEQPPSNEYLELWQYQNGNKGPCIYLELLKETDINNDNHIKRENGRMMIIGNHFMMVRDRKKTAKQLINEFGSDLSLTDKEINGDLQSIMKRIDNVEFSKQILDTEYSYGCIENGGKQNEFNFDTMESMEFQIQLSSIPFYVGRKMKIFHESNWNVLNDKFLVETDDEMQVKRYWELKHFGMNDNKVFVP